MPIVNNSIIKNINFQVYLQDNKRYFTPTKFETLDTSSEKHNKKRPNRIYYIIYYNPIVISTQ